MGIIDHKFEIYGQRGDSGDFTDLIDEAKSIATQMCIGLHSASPLYGEMIEAALQAFTETVEAMLERYKDAEMDGYDDDERAKIIEFLDTLDAEPGYLFFGYDEDIMEFDDLWTSGKKDEALDMIEADDDLGFHTLGEFKAFIANQ